MSARLRNEDMAQVLADISNTIQKDIDTFQNPLHAHTGLKVYMIISDWLEDRENLSNLLTKKLNLPN